MTREPCHIYTLSAIARLPVVSLQGHETTTAWAALAGKMEGCAKTYGQDEAREEAEPDEGVARGQGDGERHYGLFLRR